MGMTDMADRHQDQRQMPVGRRWIAWLALLLLVATPAPAAPPETLAVATAAGSRPGTRILRVTTLADAGPGSFRAAVSAEGPRVVVFEVSGYIDLERTINIRNPFLTVAGHTAPAPGIVLRQQSVVIRTHDVRLEHLAIYAGPAPTGTVRDADSLALISNARRNQRVNNIVLRNLSLGYATDENLSLAGDAIGQIRVEASLIAKGLRRAGHSEGSHSMGLLIYPNIRDVIITGNIFANNDHRNPQINAGVDIMVANNLIFGSGHRALYFQHGPAQRGGRASIIGNLFWPNGDSECPIQPIELPRRVLAATPDAQFYLADNVMDARFADQGECRLARRLDSTVTGSLATAPPVIDPQWRVMPAAEVPAFVERHAGMRPAARHPLDAAILRQVLGGTGRIIDRPEDDGGWPPAPGTRRALDLPVEEAPRDLAALARLDAWLCGLHRQAGGAANIDCPAR